jgi:peptidyl-tRNA hydrolase, PTH1 family
MWLFIGLGNLGKKYEATRHNIGFMALDLVAKELGLKFQSQFKGEFAKGSWHGQDLLLLKPQTFMNLAGQSVQPCQAFYKISLNQILVFHDDLDQPYGQIRIHKNRGHGGHNGIRDISATLGTQDYARVKMGIGRPPHPDFAVADYVLQNFSPEELSELPKFLRLSLEAAGSVMQVGVEKSANIFNQTPKKV